MNRVIVLDTGPLGKVTNPITAGENLACYQWLMRLIQQNERIIIPEIADYELRRELLRLGKISGIGRLNKLVSQLEYLPLTTEAMRRAAELWAQARQTGKPIADPHALDGDVILAAQALTAGYTTVQIATTNVEHLSQFAPADLGQNIP